ncbi:hypothetical protein [Haloarcula pelagica]|nr:hypothetical protein [Halomicroarcula sp. YJ-61-S]
MNGPGEQSAADRTVTARTVSRLFDRATVVDVALLLAVPAVLLAVASLPLPVRRALVFEYAAPSVGTAIASPFVHLDGSHLQRNLLAYGVLAPTGYALSVASGHRQRFRVVFVSLVLVCPPALSYLNLAIVREGVSVGFSGVAMALFGYLPLAIAAHLDRRFDVAPTHATAPLLFFLGLQLITVLTLGAVATNRVSVPVRGVTVPVTSVLVASLIGLVAALTLVLVLYTLAVRDHVTALTTALRTTTTRPGHFELFVLATGLFLAVPFVTFPIDPIVGDGVLNLYVHLVGYALGFIGSFTLVSIEERLSA